MRCHALALATPSPRDHLVGSSRQSLPAATANEPRKLPGRRASGIAGPDAYPVTRRAGMDTRPAASDLTSYTGLPAPSLGRWLTQRAGQQQPDAAARLARGPQLRMPHSKKQLSVCDRNAIRMWIRQGANDN